MPVRYWDIHFWDSGAGLWIKDSKLPRGGVDAFTRSKEASISFLNLADGSLAKSSSEEKANWGSFVLTFPRQVITEDVKDQLLGYIDDEKPIKIIMPIKTGASLYTEKVLEGYMLKYDETWELTGDSQQKFVIKVTMQEFDID